MKLTPQQEAALAEEMPEVFVPIPGGWGRMGMTHVRLAAASEDVLAGALRAAWKLRLERNAKPARSAGRAEPMGTVKAHRKKRRSGLERLSCNTMQESGIAGRPRNAIISAVNGPAPHLTAHRDGGKRAFRRGEHQ